MMDESFGSSASEAASEALIGVEPMSKAERLHRWADSLELQTQLGREAIDEAAPGTQADGSPLTVAFEDWAFQAEGLHDGGVENALAFFDLSESEMQRVIGSAYGSRAMPAAAAAKRVRALAKQAEAATAPQPGDLVAGGSTPSVRSRARSSTAAGRRREKGAAGAAARDGEVVRRVPSVDSPSRPPARDYAPPLSW